MSDGMLYSEEKMSEKKANVDAKNRRLSADNCVNFTIT